jgi:hypothetical protein
MKIKFGITVLLLIVFKVLSAQEKTTDKIVKRDGTVVLGKILEIGDDEIKYSDEGLREGIVIGIDKAKVEKIIFEDGRELIMDNAMSVYEDLSKQRKNGLKFNLFLPISGGYALSYERSLKPARSIEGEIGLISTSGDADMDRPEATGMFIKAGFKMMRSPDYYMRGMKYAHILKGSYVKPEIAITSFTYDKGMPNSTEYTGQESGTTTKMAVLINVGKQIIYSNLFAIDFFVGAGYAFGEIDPELHYYAFSGFSSGTSFVMTAGVRVGFLFGK